MRILALLCVLQAQEPPRDPTEADPRMKQALRQGRAAPPPPAIKLRAVVVAKGKPGAAVLQLGETLHRVAAGSAIVDAGVSWKVASVNAEEVRLEAVESGQGLVLR